MSDLAIAVVNLKGGVGKTTISIILSEIALMKKNKVLAIDLDPQENFCAGLSYVSGYFKDRLRIKKNLNREKDSEAPENLIIIDCPPRIDDSSVRAAMSFADIILIPVRPDMFSLINLDKVFTTANLDKDNQKAKNQLPIVKVGFDTSKISRYVETLLYDYDYPIIGEIPLFKHIPYNISQGRMWSVGLTAAQRKIYDDIFDKIYNAYKLMKDGKFEEPWGEESVQEDFEFNDEQEADSNSEVTDSKSKQFSENRFLGN